MPVGGVGVRHVWQSCEKRRDGKRLQQTTVQNISLMSITQPLYFVC